MAKIKFNYREDREEIAKFRNGKFYDNYEESPFASFFSKDFEHSELIDGNCVVVKREIPMFGTRYVSYFVDSIGYVSSIKEGFSHGNSMEDATAWLKSNDFFVNKIKYLSECDLPMYVFYADEGHENEGINAHAMAFKEQYTQYLKKKNESLNSSVTFEM